MPSALRQQRPGTPFRNPFPPVIRVENPYDHVAALWPGFLDGRPVGGKSILRPKSELGWAHRQSRLSLVQRTPTAPAGENALADELLFVSAKPEAGTADEQISQIATYLRSLDGARECYISVNTFFGRRNQANLKHLTSLMVDLDLSKARDRGNDFAGDFMALRQSALDALSAAGIPMPNLSTHTGKGVHFYWLFDRSVPSAAVPRWQACLNVLIKLLRPFGSDETVRDTARVLRLVGTVNTSAPAHCRKVTAQVLVATRQAFDFLADQILPLTRADLAAARAARLIELAPKRALRDARKQLQAGAATPGPRRNKRSFSATAIARLTDLNLLAATLFPHGVPHGQRDRYLFAVTCNLAWMCRQQTLVPEMLAWKNRHIPSMSDVDAIATMGAALRKAEEAYQAMAAGSRFGPYGDPRYVHAAATLWQTFGHDIEGAGLTAQMQAILPAGVLKERQKAARRAQSLDHYTRQGIRLGNVPRALEARERRSRGQSLREIAQALGTTPKTISAWLDLSLEALGLTPSQTTDPANAARPPASPPPSPPPSYPQAEPDSTERANVLPKFLLNNGVAERAFGEASQMRAAQGGSGGISALPTLPTGQGGERPRVEGQGGERDQLALAVDSQHTTGSPASAAATPVPSDARASADPKERALPKSALLGKAPHLPSGPKTRAAPLAGRPGFGTPREQFDEELLRDMRRWPLQHGLRSLGLHFKADATYVPRTGDERLHVSLESGQVVELIVTGIRWFDTKAEKGGGGVIDLTMHLLGCNFVVAVRRLTSS